MMAFLYNGLLILGAAFILLGTLCLDRFPTFFSRLRAFILFMTLGILLMYIGTVLSLGYATTTLVSIKFWLACGIQVLTIPLIGQLIGRVHFSKDESWQDTESSH